MAEYKLTDAKDGLFTVELVSGEVNADEQQLFEDLRRALSYVQEYAPVDKKSDLISRLRVIAESGLTGLNHSAREPIQDIQLILKEIDPEYYPWITGKYFSAAITEDENKLPDLVFYKNVGEPPKEYFEFIARMNEIGFGLKSMLDSTTAGTRRAGMGSHFFSLARRLMRRKPAAVTENAGETTAVRQDSIVSTSEAAQVQKRFQNYLERIALLGATALGRDEIAASTALLASLEQEIVRREGPRIKNTYVLDLGKIAFPFFAGFVIIYTAIRVFGGPVGNGASVLVRFREFFLLAAGCSVGTWLSYRIRNPRFTGVTDLVELEVDQLSPINRVLFSIGLTTVIGLIFQTQLVVIAVNQFTSNFQYNGVRALLIGMFCGVSEIALGDVVGRRAGEFVNQAGTSKERAAP